MGAIKDGKVSGVMPSKEAFAVHYPGYPSSVSRAVQTLGGTDAIVKARSSESNKLELYFRPEDPYSHPAFGELCPCNNFLLRISKHKPGSNKPKSELQVDGNSNQEATDSANRPERESQVETDICADIVRRVPEAYHFEGMVDYQHVVAVHAEAARSKKRNWTEIEEPHFEKAGLMDLDQEDVMILLPPLFSLKDVPESTVLRPPASTSGRRRQDDVVENQYEMNIEPALAIDFNIKEIPKEINWKECIIRGSDLWVWQMAVSELFEERPVWPKSSLAARLLEKGLKFSHQTFKRLLLTVAYYFSGGPFLRFWIRKGYDPRKDPDSRIYQRIDFRVPPQLRSYCDANATNTLKHRWEDLCKFQVFPYKSLTLQLYELDDDYIQEEIRKPSKQTTCTHGTGWFLQHVHDTFRHRVMMRFLSVYPKPGAKKLLKATSEDFEKSKRASRFKDVPKPDQEEQQQNNREVVGVEANENRSGLDDGEVNEIATDDHEDELDEDEALDLADEDDEISLQSNAYLDMENNSKNYLQELFDSFPSTDAGAEKLQEADSSGEEYQIYEQDDDDENYPDYEDDNDIDDDIDADDN